MIKTHGPKGLCSRTMLWGQISGQPMTQAPSLPGECTVSQKIGRSKNTIVWIAALTQRRSGLQASSFGCKGQWQNMLTGMHLGLNATSVDNPALGLAGTMVNGSRMLYYQNAKLKNIMELNNTDFPTGSKSGYTEAWVANASTKGSGDASVNVGGKAAPASNASGISTPAQAMLGSKLSMAQGYRGLVRQLFLFYQTNGSDITWRSRNEYDIGQWTDPVALNVGV